MYCKKCGSEIKEGAKFCPKCGTSVAIKSIDLPTTDTPKPTRDIQDDKGINHNWVKLAVIGAVGLGILAVVIFLMFKLSKPKDTGKHGNDEGHHVTVEQNEDGNMELQPDMEPLYGDEFRPSTIDLYTYNVAAGPKWEGQTWDRSLFYWLEDCDPNSDSDNNIKYCKVERKLLTRRDNGVESEYVVYRDPNTDEIFKIVSIVPVDSGVELTDYYYLNGKPNFVFKRIGTQFTGDFAASDKVGERYYLNADTNTMVKWRIIREDMNIEEYTLAPSDTGHNQVNYFQTDVNFQTTYDAVERDALNTAYNTYDAILAANNVGVITGYVKDDAGNGIANALISVYRKDDGTLMYQYQAEVDGYFRFYVDRDGTECYISVVKEGYQSSTLNDIVLETGTVTYSYSKLILHDK